jgi:hypothetical protein
VRLKCRVFGCKTGPIATVWVFMWWDQLQWFGSSSNPDPEQYWWVKTVANTKLRCTLNLEPYTPRVSNSSNPLERFWVRIGTGTEPLQRALPRENPYGCNWVGFTTKHPVFQYHNFASNYVGEFWWYRDVISIWNVQYDQLFHLPILNLWSDQYSLSRYSNPANFSRKGALISQPLNEYWSDRKSETGMWKDGENCTIYILIMPWYDQNWNS